MDEDQLMKLINQRQREIDQQEKMQTSTKNSSSIDENYQKIQNYISSLDQYQSEDKTLKDLFELYEILAPISQNSEVKVSQYNTEINWMRQDTETFQETNKIQQNKQEQLTHMITEIRKASVKIQKEIDKLEGDSSETNQVQNVLSKQQEKLEEIKKEIVKMETECVEKDTQNGEIQVYLKEMIKKYEIKEKLYVNEWKDVDAYNIQDEFNKERKQNLMNRINKIKEDAARMTHIKVQLESKGKEQSDIKLKIGLFGHKFTELESTLEKAIQLLDSFKNEIEKLGSQKKLKLSRKSAMLKRVRIVSDATVNMHQELQKQKQRLKNSQKQKDKLRTQLMKLQSSEKDAQITLHELKEKVGQK